MNKKIAIALMLSLASSASFAGGTMPPEKLLFLEGGFSYSYTLYKDSITSAESYTVATPNGVAIDPNDFYPNNFYGGYIGASLYMSQFLLNTRLDMYSSGCKTNSEINERGDTTEISIAPARFSATVDRVFGDINTFSYGIGAGAVLETINQGEFREVPPQADRPGGETLNGSRYDATVEAFAMYRMGNLGLKLNAAYQIPVNSLHADGDVNVNLGVNYSFPV